MDKRGFSLIELLITIAIIGILAAAATTAYVGTIKKGARSEAFSNLESLRLLEEQFFAENAAYAPAGGGQIPYRATPLNNADGGIEDELPGFRPGGCTVCAAPFGINFEYTIQQDVALPAGIQPVPYAGAIVDPSPTPCFVAVATGFPGTRVCPNIANCDVYVIDCNNVRNF